MPLSQAVADESTTGPDGEPVAGSVPAAYKALTAGLLAVLAARLAPSPGMPWPSWRMRRTAQAIQWRSDVARAVQDVTGRVESLVTAGITRAAARGAAEAARDVRWAGQLPAAAPDAARAAVGVLLTAHPRIVAVLSDTYRAAITASAGVTGDPVPQIQRVLDDLARRGITGYVDTAGRRWSLEHYVEVVVRRAYADAAAAAYLEVCRRAGVWAVLVSDHHCPHAACAVWEGRYLSIDGRPAGRYRAVTPGGRVVDVDIAGTWEQSRAAGLWHPGCGHRIVGSLPGSGRRMRRQPHRDHVAQASRRYRARTARAWERRARVALTDPARRQAAAKARNWRAT